MLYQFTFKNFKSYKDETIFDMQAENIEEFSNTLLETSGKRKILPISVIYGPNGGGKSSLLEAMVALISIVMKPIRILATGTQLFENRHFAILQKCEPYKLNKTSTNEPTEFEMYFDSLQAEYRYILKIFKDKIIEEALYQKKYDSKKPAKIYSRINDDIVLGEILKKENVGTSVNQNMPYLTYLSINNNINLIKDVMSYFYNVIAVNYANSQKISIKKLKDKNVKEMLLLLLKSMDVDICDYRIEEENEKKTVFTKHKTVEGEFELNLNEESQGTKKLFSLIPDIIYSIVFGGVTIIDELDAKLHPKLLQNIIGLYTDKELNTRKGQLIFTSHDLTTMNNKIFRRDEIWFACKNEKEESEIYSLYEIRDEKGEHIRANSNFNKQYMEGRYGADPYLTTIQNWEVDE